MLTKITPAIRSNPQLVNFLVVEGMGQDKKSTIQIKLPDWGKVGMFEHSYSHAASHRSSKQDPVTPPGGRIDASADRSPRVPQRRFPPQRGRTGQPAGRIPQYHPPGYQQAGI